MIGRRNFITLLGGRKRPFAVASSWRSDRGFARCRCQREKVPGGGALGQRLGNHFGVG